MKKRKGDHVIVLAEGDHAGAECLHCGEKCSIRLPMEILSWLSSVDAFNRIHKNCPAPVDPEKLEQKELTYG